MEILEKILTGNLGYGTVVLIVMLFVGVYQQFIVPKLEKADKLEEEKNKEIKDLEASIKEKDDLIGLGIENQKSHSEAIEKLADSSLVQISAIESLSNIKDLMKVLTKIQDEIKELSENYTKDSLDIKNELKQDGNLLEKIKTEIENKLKPLIKEGSTESIEAISSIEKNVRNLSSQRFNEQTQLSTSLSNISTELSELKSLTAVQLNSRLHQSRIDDGTMQDLK